jgi:hypothetical protein
MKCIQINSYTGPRLLRRRRQLPVNKCTSGKFQASGNFKPKRNGTRSCPCTKSVKIVDLKPEDVIILTYMFSWITILEYMLIKCTILRMHSMGIPRPTFTCLILLSILWMVLTVIGRQQFCQLSTHYILRLWYNYY